MIGKFDNLTNTSAGGQGITFTSAVRDKMRKAKLGTKLSETHRLNLSKAARGKVKSQSHRNAISKSNSDTRRETALKDLGKLKVKKIMSLYKQGYTLDNVAYMLKLSRRRITSILKWSGCKIKKRGFGGNRRWA